ncbi:MAG: hypothetical protein ABSG21_09300 [Spirochaetia bacterium]|jgi:hypothetical protein
MNALMVVGVVLDAIVGIAYGAAEGTVAFLICFILVALSVAGLIVVARGSKKAGAILVIIGAAGFVPLGLIAIFGAKRVLDQAKAGQQSHFGQKTAAQMVQTEGQEGTGTPFAVPTSTWINPTKPLWRTVPSLAKHAAGIFHTYCQRCGFPGIQDLRGDGKFIIRCSKCGIETSECESDSLAWNEWHEKNTRI